MITIWGLLEIWHITSAVQHNDGLSFVEISGYLNELEAQE
jgi:hypothetical protein